ncbi:MAG: aminotransferase, partial [Myxococcota bacterium]|nr:aminotransferase [Myxococcota bacterium]
IARWSETPEIRVLGNPTAWRLSIVSFMVRHGKGYLHHNYVVALLNDLFGIQARGGCSCAGPYGHRLLGIDLTTSKEFEREVMKGCEGVKPGWTRVNFNYFISETVFEFLLSAVEFIAEHGWKLLPEYTFEPDTGQWRHARWRREGVKRLSDLSYRSGRLQYRSRHATEPEWALAAYLEEAKAIVDAYVAAKGTAAEADTSVPLSFEPLRWFPLPSDVLAELAGGAGWQHTTPLLQQMAPPAR